MAHMMMFKLLLIWILILRPAQSNILEETNSIDESGKYHFSFKTSNGLTRNEVGTVKNDQKKSVEGSYSYTDPNGNEVIVQYKSDENGYVTVKDVEGVESATEAPLKSPTILLSHQLKMPAIVWVRQPVISPFVLFNQLGISTFTLRHLLAKPPPTHRTKILSAVNSYRLEKPTVMPVTEPQEKPNVTSDLSQTLSNVPATVSYVPSHSGQMSTTAPDNKLHNQTISFVPYSDIIDIPNRQPDVTQEVVPPPVLYTLLGGSSELLK
ncbi:uncharacterized protein LOC125226737 [Leguminivora glycinivorella]|uniref:uncharacterized protein LOC125226737 n=1 Tax=Leguminivora glycinivorella TaxID=1035111 RepID=UPI00200FE1FF|nr:uncharacterized protein LOC125226737 [Leguminivora glycinivorella]